MRIGLPEAVIGNRPLLAHLGHLRRSPDPADQLKDIVFDFIKPPQKSNASQTRMNARGVFSTLLNCFRL
jgi:hypothetical protein